MKYLLDTSVLLKARAGEDTLNEKGKRILSDPEADLYLSAVCTWEISIKFASRALKLPFPPSEFIRNSLVKWRLHSVDITHGHALAAAELPLHHRDPFDRMLVAQARLEGMTLLTTDPGIGRYDVESLYCGK
jgi:PIN domain nuclease of toxin-antitoxin system